MKKGFIFVETMVCIAFLGTVLLTVYASFTNVLDNAKVRLMYDDPVYLYRTYYILNYLEENGLNEYINEKFSSQVNNTTYITEFGCSAVGAGLSETISEKAFCEKLFSQNGDWHVNHIFIMPYNVNKVVSCANSADINSGDASNCRRNSSLKNLSIQGVNYLYSLDGYTGTPEEDEILDRTNTMSNIDPTHQIYRIVIEFKVAGQEEEYTYYDYCLKNSAACANWNPSAYQKTAKIRKNKFYYTSLEIPNGYNDAYAIDGYRLKIKYDGNGAAGWCSGNPDIVLKDTYAYNNAMGSEYWEYGNNEIINGATATGLSNVNYEKYICFNRPGYYVPYQKEWNTKPDGTGVSFDQENTSLRSNDVANAVGCDLNHENCTVTLYADWKKAPDTANYVIRRTNTTYSDMASAAAAAAALENGEEILALRNVTDTSSPVFTKPSVLLSLTGYTITMNNYIRQNGGATVIRGGTITSSGNYTLYVSSGQIVINDQAKIINTSNNPDGAPNTSSAIYIGNGVVNMNGLRSEIKAGNGANTYFTRGVFINGGTFYMSTGTITVNVSKPDGSLSTGVTVNSGKLSMSGGTINVSKAYAPSGAIIVNDKANITGGTLKLSSKVESPHSTDGGALYAGQPTSVVPCIYLEKNKVNFICNDTLNCINIEKGVLNTGEANRNALLARMTATNVTNDPIRKGAEGTINYNSTTKCF